MPGTHRPASPSRWIGAGDARLPLVAVAVVGVVLVVAATARSVVVPAMSCGSTTELTVAVAPDLAPAIETVARRYNAKTRQVHGDCVRVDVVAKPPAELAALLAARLGGAVDGGSGGDHGSGAADQATGGGSTSSPHPDDRLPALPDAWIPDSSTWLDQVRELDREAIPAGTPSIAMTPVVLAMPEQTARSLGWPIESISWSDVLGGTGQPPVRLGATDPRQDAAALAGLVAARDALRPGGSSQGISGSVLDVYRRMIGVPARTAADLLAAFPTADRPAVRDELAGAPLPEQVVLRYNAEHGRQALAAVHTEPAAPALDFPYATLPGPRHAAALAFRAELGHDDARRDLARAGFRSPDGSIGPGFRTGNGITGEPAEPVPMPPVAVVQQVLDGLAEVTAPVRLLSLVDISGSMAAPTGYAGQSRLGVGVAGLRRGLDLISRTSHAGLWTVGTGTRGYTEVLPVAPLDAGHNRFDRALAELGPVGGPSGLYEAVLAGYQWMIAGYRPGWSNAITLVTDGHLGRDGELHRLLDALERLAEPTRPVHLVVIGVGPDADRTELRTIAAATGGTAYFADDPAAISTAMLHGLAGTI